MSFVYQSFTRLRHYYNAAPFSRHNDVVTVLQSGQKHFVRGYQCYELYVPFNSVSLFDSLFADIVQRRVDLSDNSVVTPECSFDLNRVNFSSRLSRSHSRFIRESNYFYAPVFVRFKTLYVAIEAQLYFKPVDSIPLAL